MSKFIYSGHVYIYAESKSGRTLLGIHNAGTEELSRLFAYMITGQDHIDECCPSYMSLYSVNNKSCLLEDSKILNKKWVYEEAQYEQTDRGSQQIKSANYRAYLEAKISKKSVKTSVSAANKLVLLDGCDPKNILAYVEFTNESALSNMSEIFENTNNIIVVWEMELLIPEEGRWKGENQ